MHCSGTDRSPELLREEEGLKNAIPGLVVNVKSHQIIGPAERPLTFPDNLKTNDSVLFYAEFFALHGHHGYGVKFIFGGVCVCVCVGGGGGGANPAE